MNILITITISLLVSIVFYNIYDFIKQVKIYWKEEEK